ncbi:MAG: DUF1697 domain-containing protein [Actinobacteria bacterium]|nr:DUF1697 domain-containing protein [Actinomycetota bacterium]
MASTRLVGLLRAVNVGGRSLPMTALRDIVSGLGHRDVVTFIQSGNVVFTTDRAARTIAQRDAIGAEIEEGLATEAGLRTTVMVRTAAELAAAVESMPFAGAEPNRSRLMVVFLAGRPSAEAIGRLEPDRFAPDRFEVSGREMYVHYPQGAGTSKFNGAYYDKRLGVLGTARNLNTVAKLVELAST